jgi:light-regulated signal transduction histidine kinase (bacteriophytochrome)
LTEIALDKAMLYEDTINKSIEIQNRNKELDDFTYVVSHDLKEPLISIEGYSKILLKDYRDKIDEDGREYLGSVVQSSGRMKGLIEDLLTLSRVGRTAEAMQMVSVSEMINEIVHDLHFTLREKNVQIVVEPGLPTVQYNPTQLSMIFRNLISNAMKFTDKADPRITIGAKDDTDEFVFSVADNGIGIAKQYFERIFMIFQRLHRSEEFRGTGAGLTIVKKIVENHKGRIWLDSTLGEGTTFYFTVPKTQLSTDRL